MIASLISWNILAPIWINLTRYEANGADLNLLHTDKRLLLVVYRLTQYDADIINLQEVQEDQFNVIKSELGDDYGACFTTHQTGYWSDEHLPEGTVFQKNGQATFFRKNKLNLVMKQDVQISKEGNVALFAVFELCAGSEHCPKTSSYLILANCHFESGRQEWKLKARVQQARVIHEQFNKMRQKLKEEHPESFIHVAALGDFNTDADRPGMQEWRNLGYVDVAEMTQDKVQPTIFSQRKNIELQLDHFFLMKSDVEAKTIGVKKYQVPVVESPEYDAESHEETIIKALASRMRRTNSSYEDALRYLISSQILSHIKPSSAEVKETKSMKALRVGSDHLPIYLELDMETL